MDFRLTEEQESIKTMVRDFAESEIKPHLADWDEKQHFPVDTFKRAGELGLLGVTLPEEYGGAGLSYVDYANVIKKQNNNNSKNTQTDTTHKTKNTGHTY